MLVRRLKFYAKSSKCTRIVFGSAVAGAPDSGTRPCGAAQCGRVRKRIGPSPERRRLGERHLGDHRQLEHVLRLSTPNSRRVQLLQNGSEFSSSVSAFSSSPLASAVTSKVDSVTLTSATQAKVKYDLSAMGTTVAKGASGTSVLQDGTWKVGDGVSAAC